MASGGLQVENLITHRFDHADAVGAYELIQNDGAALGVVLKYPTDKPQLSPVSELTRRPAAAAGKAAIGVIGAGAFAKGMFLPALAKSLSKNQQGDLRSAVSAGSETRAEPSSWIGSKTRAELCYVADLNAVAAKHAAAKFGPRRAVTDYTLMLNDPEVAAVFVVAPHQIHARLVCEALESGKHVFVEKPLAIRPEELDRVVQTANNRTDRHVMVGFNRRFSPHTIKAKQLLEGRAEPLCMHMMVNAGDVPADSWVQDPERGGGRIIGEACHFIDLLRHLAGSPVVTVSAMMVGPGPAVREDKMSIVLRLADGSIAAVSYFVRLLGC
jgi:predicted dehydrogenase